MATVVVLVAIVGLVVPDLDGPDLPAVLASLALQIVHSVPQTSRWRNGWTLAAMAALFPFGGHAGFLAASSLLIIRGRQRWGAFLAVVLAAAAMNTGSTYEWANAAGNAVSQGLVVFALTRLNDLRRELQATREELATQSVRRARQRASDELDAAIGTSFVRIVGLADRGALAEIASTARAAARRVRRATTPDDAVAYPSTSDMTPRLTLPIVAIVLLQYPLVAAIYIGSTNPPATLLVLYLATVLTVVLLQAYHCLPRPPGGSPRYARLTLPAQVVLACAPMFGPDRAYPQLVSFAAASIVIVLNDRRGWIGFAVVVAYVPAVLLGRGTTPAEATYWTVETICTAMLFYGIALLTQLVHQVREARHALAAHSVANEDRRIASDVHDLLGYSLSAIVAKAELAARAPDLDEQQRSDIIEIAEQSLADLRSITVNETTLSVAAEVESAHDVLTASGISVDVTAEPPELDDEVERLVATVVREGVTNVLRHGRARTVEITVVAERDDVRLTIANDRAPFAPATSPSDGTGGNGLDNLARKVDALGGQLRAEHTPNGFELSVLQPTSVARDPDGVDPVASIQLRHDGA